MNQHEAPIGTVATIGHPSNGSLIIKQGEGWVHYDDRTRPVNPEDFRAGWDLAPRPLFEVGYGRPDLDILHQVVSLLDSGFAASEIRQMVAEYIARRPDDRGEVILSPVMREAIRKNAERDHESSYEGLEDCPAGYSDGECYCGKTEADLAWAEILLTEATFPQRDTRTPDAQA